MTNERDGGIKTYSLINLGAKEGDFFVFSDPGHNQPYSPVRRITNTDKKEVYDVRAVILDTANELIEIDQPLVASSNRRNILNLTDEGGAKKVLLEIKKSY